MKFSEGPPGGPPDGPPKAVGLIRNGLIILPILTGVTLLLRLYTRYKFLRLRWDDYTLIVAWGAFLSTCMVQLQFNIEFASEFKLDIHLFAAGSVLYTATMGLIKLSLGLFFLNIITVPGDWRRHVIHAITWTSVAFSSAFVIYQAATCATNEPPEPSLGVITGSSAIDAAGGGPNTCPTGDIYRTLNTSWSVYNVIGDFVLCGISLSAIARIQLPFWARLSSCLLIALAAAGAIAGAIRVSLLTAPAQNFQHGIYIGLWTIIEPACCILAACLAVLRPLFANHIKALRSNLSSTGGFVASLNVFHSASASGRPGSSGSGKDSPAVEGVNGSGLGGIGGSDQEAYGRHLSSARSLPKETDLDRLESGEFRSRKASMAVPPPISKTEPTAEWKEIA